MLEEAPLAAAVKELPSITLAGTFARRVPLAALLGLHSTVPAGALPPIVTPRFLLTSTAPYRYTPPGVEALYLGEGEDAAAAETKQHPGLAGFGRTPAAPDAVFHVEIKLGAVLDLTEDSVLPILHTHLAELAAPWRLKSPTAPTQTLGAAVVASGRFEAIRYPCAPLHRVGVAGSSLVIFRSRLRPGSTVELHDPTRIWRERWQ